MRQKEEMRLKILMCSHTYDSCTCVSGITYNIEILKELHFKYPLLRRIKPWNISPKKTGKHTLQLAINVPCWKICGSRRCAPRAAARGNPTRSKSAYFLSDFARTPGAYALIVTMLRALRSVVSSSSETSGISAPSYMCMHSLCLAPASCTMVFSELIHNLKGMHVRYHCLLLLKGTLKVSFGARKRVLKEFLKQNHGECNAHFFASCTVCLARC